MAAGIDKNGNQIKTFNKKMTKWPSAYCSKTQQPLLNANLSLAPPKPRL